MHILQIMYFGIGILTLLFQISVYPNPDHIYWEISSIYFKGDYFQVSLFRMAVLITKCAEGVAELTEGKCW